MRSASCGRWSSSASARRWSSGNVANLTRADAAEFFDVASRAEVKTEIACYRLEDANRALADLRKGRLQGAAALDP